MKNKNNIQKELKELSPFLLEHKNKFEGYDVPKNYFKSLPDEIIKQLNIVPEKTVEEKENWFVQLTQSIQYFFQPRYALAYASVALLLIAGVFFIKNIDGENPSEITAVALLNDVSDEVLNEYISANIGEFDETILTEELADNMDSPLPGLDFENDDELMDELIEGLDMEDLEELF